MPGLMEVTRWLFSIKSSVSSLHITFQMLITFKKNVQSHQSSLWKLPLGPHHPQDSPNSSECHGTPQHPEPSQTPLPLPSLQSQNYLFFREHPMSLYTSMSLICSFSCLQYHLLTSLPTSPSKLSSHSASPFSLALSILRTRTPSCVLPTAARYSFSPGYCKALLSKLHHRANTPRPGPP